MLSIDYKNCLNFINNQELSLAVKQAKKSDEVLLSGQGEGSEFLGWLNISKIISRENLAKLYSISKKLIKINDVVIVIGIGGSYLGARAVIEALKHKNNSIKKYPEILFAGNNVNENYLRDILEKIKNKNFSLIVISKSGTTLEPAIAFRILRRKLELKYGKRNASERIIAITDSQKGVLKQIAEKNSYETLNIPEDIGGRYSVLTNAGLLPVSVAGCDIGKLLDGSAEMQKNIDNSGKNNIVYLYASLRNLLYKKGKVIEILATYEPSLFYFTEWWKQLYGESEGKDGKGIFPANATFTTDLHSLGQLIQEGKRNIFETVLIKGKSENKLKIPFDKENLDKLNYLGGEEIKNINRKAFLGTVKAHTEGGVPNIIIKIPELTEKYIGQLIYFFERACAISCYMLGVNPFNQPGVEAYKKNMYKLLGK